MKETHTHTNRYGEVFTFEHDDGGNILWEGNFEYIRTSLNEDKDVIMVDPAGGPYLCSGMESELIHSDIEGKEIVKFEYIETGFKIILK